MSTQPMSPTSIDVCHQDHGVYHCARLNRKISPHHDPSETLLPRVSSESLSDGGGRQLQDIWLGTPQLAYKGMENFLTANFWKQSEWTPCLLSHLNGCHVSSQKKRTLKGSIELSRIKCVEIVKSDISIPCHYKYPFQVSSSGTTVDSFLSLGDG